MCHKDTEITCIVKIIQWYHLMIEGSITQTSQSEFDEKLVCEIYFKTKKKNTGFHI